MASDWQLLPSSKPKSPFFARTRFQHARYTVDVTDLSSIWSEVLGKDQIVARAHEVNSDIHPGDDPSQMQILLDKINGAFGQVEGTQLFFRPMGEKLDLYVTVPLPGGLNDLQWSMHLTKQPPASMKTELFNPLVALSYLQKQQVEELSSLLGQKDEAIGKILDKLESMGIDYGTMFPNARLNRKLNPRAQLMRQVKGLAVFDSATWTADSLDGEPGEVPSTTAIPHALRGSGSRSVQTLSRSLCAVDGAASPSRPRDQTSLAERQRSPVKVNRDHQAPSQVDGFQRQSTPHKAKHTRDPSASPAKMAISGQVLRRPCASKSPPKPANGPDDGDETTEDEEDLDAGMPDPTPSQQEPARASRSPAESVRPPEPKSPSPAVAPKTNRSHPPTSPSPSNPHRSTTSTPSLNNEESEDRDSKPPPKKGKLGAIGHRKRASPTPSPPKAAEPDAAELTKDTEMADASDPTPDPLPEASPTPAPDETNPEPAPPKPVPQTRKLGKIGKIGGARGQKPIQAQDDPPPKAESVALSIEPASSTATASATASNGTRQPSPPPSAQPLAATKKAEKEEEEELDPKMKADRKREALKRDLEGGRRGGKKKRKF